MRQIMIMKLDQGYLVQQSILSKWEPLAALSNGRDLCEWIAKWSGAKVDIFDHYEPVTGFARDGEKGKPLSVDDAQPEEEDPRKVLHRAMWDERQAERAAQSPEQETERQPRESPATPPQEPQDSDPKPDTAEVPDEPESAPAGNNDGHLPRNQRNVLRHLHKAAERHGPRFQIELATLAEKAGVPRGSMHYIVGRLEDIGFISVERPGTGIAPFFTVTEAGMQVAA